MKTLTKLLIGAGFALAEVLGISYSANAQYTDELYWKYHNKLPSNSTNQTNCYQSPSEKRQTKKKIKKAFRTNDWLNNHTHEFSYGNMNQNADPFTFRTNLICGTEYIWKVDTSDKKTGDKIYIATREDVDINLSFLERKSVWRKEYEIKPLKNSSGEIIKEVLAKNIKLKPILSSGIYNEDDFARNYVTETIGGRTYILTCTSKDNIREITGNLNEEVLPIYLVPVDTYFDQIISGKNGEVILRNTEGIMYATTNKDNPTNSSQSIIIPSTQRPSLKDSANLKKDQPKENKYSHVVQKGDNFYKIARDNKTSPEKLRKLNTQIPNINLIKEGDTIWLQPKNKINLKE